MSQSRKLQIATEQVLVSFHVLYLKYVGERKLLVSYLLHDIILFNSRLTNLRYKKYPPVPCHAAFLF